MSSTRTAEEGSPFRQERYCSSPEFTRGLMANMVAKSARILPDPGDRDLIWWVQAKSLEDGGLRRLAAGLVERFPSRIGNRTMRERRVRSGQTLPGEVAEAVEDSLPGGRNGALLRRTRQLSGEAVKPSSAQPADRFLDRCRRASEEHLETDLAKFCLRDERSLQARCPWYFADLVDCLRELMGEEMNEALAGLVETSISRQVCGAMDYAFSQRCLVVVDGPPRLGKTHAAKAWCASRGGRVRFVQVPPSNDEFGYFRAIARALGVSINTNSKALELRERAEEVLHTGDLMLVLDEADYLWPQTNPKYSKPKRVNWLMAELVNYGVPVVLIARPEFYQRQLEVEELAAWDGEQFTGRIGHVQRLPDNLEEADYLAVAGHLFPHASRKVVGVLADYALSSRRRLASLDAIANRARYLASQAGRNQASEEDIRRAMKESVLPTDQAIAKALEGRTAANRPKRGRTPALAQPARRGGVVVSRFDRLTAPDLEPAGR